MDDAHIGPPLDPTPMQAANVVPYRGGFAPDPGTTNYKDNFTIEADTSGGPQRSRLIAPLRLPKARRDHDGRDGRGRSRSRSWRERRRALVHDRAGIGALFHRRGRPHPCWDRDSGRHRERGIFRRPRRHQMRGPLGLRLLGARGEAPARSSAANSMCRSGPASPCGSRRSITARSDIQGTSGPFVSRWNNEENMQGDRQRRAVSRELRRPVARLGVDEWRRSSARLPRRNLRRLQGAPRRRHGIRWPDAGRRHDPCLPGADRLRSRDCDRGGARSRPPCRRAWPRPFSSRPT